MTRDYTCSRCGTTANGIPYGPVGAEWCLDCVMERAEIERLKRSCDEYLDGGVEIPDSARLAVIALCIRRTHCQREADNARTQAEAYDAEANEIEKALKTVPRRYLPDFSRRQLRLALESV